MKKILVAVDGSPQSLGAARLGQEIASATGASLTEVRTIELEGPAAERIADLAENDGYDLVVVGSRGRNVVARVFLGSVADRLVHICKKSVLVAR